MASLFGEAPAFSLPLMPTNLPIRRCPTSREDAPLRILIVRTFANGDILMGTPLLSNLREHYPDAHITWMVERREQQVIDAHPMIDELLLWTGAYWKKPARYALYPLYVQRILALRARLRPYKFDWLISLQPEDWPFLPYATGASVRIGIFDTFREYHRRTKTSRRTRLYTHAFTHGDLPKHRTEQYLLPLTALNIPAQTRHMTMGWTAADETAADAFLIRNGIPPGTPFLVLAPMTGWPSRCWPVERYAELADSLLSEENLPNHRILLIGSGKQSERSALDAIARIMRYKPIVAAGILSFRELAAVISRAALLIGSDSGPMHIAGAVATSYVALFGPTAADARTPLVGRGVALQHPVFCGPCEQFQCPNTTPETHQMCMGLIGVDEVRDAVRRLL